LSENENCGGVFCLRVEGGQENYVGRFLRNAGMNVVPAFAERAVVRKGKTKRVTRPLMPGYLFFTCDYAPDWGTVKRMPSVYKALSYPDGSFALRGRDLDFVRLLMKNNGVYKISRAVSEGAKIKIIDGPLKNLEGGIIKVNRRKGRALVRIEGEGIINNIWLGFELIGERE
jgi:transcriptional antiterminator NusG